MKFNFTNNEMTVLLMSLITRRSTLLRMVEIVPAYSKDLAELESLMEKIFPGSLETFAKTQQEAS